MKSNYTCLFPGNEGHFQIFHQADFSSLEAFCLVEGFVFVVFRGVGGIFFFWEPPNDWRPFIYLLWNTSVPWTLCRSHCRCSLVKAFPWVLKAPLLSVPITSRSGHGWASLSSESWEFLAVSNSELEIEKYAPWGNNSLAFTAVTCHSAKQMLVPGSCVIPDIATGTKRTFICLSSFAKMELSLGSHLCWI